MTVQAAATGSVNCAFVRMSTSVGMDKVIDMAQKMGMRPNVAGRQPVNEWKVLTFTLGVISITPLEMASIASTIGGGGVHHDPVFVQKVVGADGKVVFDETGRPGTRVLDPDVAACEVSILHGPLGAGGTASGKGIPWPRRVGQDGHERPPDQLGVHRRDAQPGVVRLARQSRRGRTRRRVRSRGSEHDLAQLHDPGDPGRTR